MLRGMWRVGESFDLPVLVSISMRNVGHEIESLDADEYGSGDLYVSKTLKLNGHLHVDGDLEIKGDLVMQKGSVVTVKGKKTIHGSVKEV